jgi:nicotinamidase-related amidase
VVVHPSGIRQDLVDKVVARRGRLHAFERLDPSRTALVVIDLDTGTVRRCLQDTVMATVIAPVNAVAAAVRAHGGVVAWVRTPIQRASDRFVAIFGPSTARMYEEEGAGVARTLWHELDVRDEDLQAVKTGSSAFFPGKCDVPERLAERGVDTVLIAGAVTNVCCGSSARDASELGYRIVMVSDALVGQSFGVGEAELATIFRCFGDVRPSSEVTALLAAGAG